MSMFNQPPRPPSPGMDRGAQMAARRAERASKPKTAQARATQRNAEGTPQPRMPRGRGPIGSIDDYSNAQIPGREFIERITGGGGTQPAPMPDGSRLSESARETDLPRVSKNVTDDEYNFWLQNIDRPFNTPEVNQKVSDIARRLENEQRFVTQYSDRPYLDPTKQDLANQAMVSAIMTRMQGGQ